MIVPFNALASLFYKVLPVMKRLFVTNIRNSSREPFQKCTFIASLDFVTFYKYIANIIIDRLNFCEWNNFMQVTLPDCKILLIIRRIFQLFTNFIESVLQFFFYEIYKN